MVVLRLDFPSRAALERLVRFSPSSDCTFGRYADLRAEWSLPMVLIDLAQRILPRHCLCGSLASFKIFLSGCRGARFYLTAHSSLDRRRAPLERYTSAIRNLIGSEDYGGELNAGYNRPIRRRPLRISLSPPIRAPACQAFELFLHAVRDPLSSLPSCLQSPPSVSSRLQLDGVSGYNDTCPHSYSLRILSLSHYRGEQEASGAGGISSLRQSGPSRVTLEFVNWR